MPRRRRISRCSRVWGITESSAATTSRARSRPVAPASMLRMNRSWPGTSTSASRLVAQVERGETQVDRDPALLLGGEAVGVDAGQGPHQRGLAVVDVPRRADHQVAPCHAAQSPVDPSSVSPRRTGAVDWAEGRAEAISEGANSQGSGERAIRSPYRIENTRERID